MITLDRIAICAFLDLAGQQPDFTDEVLCARVMTAGKMDIDRRVERNARFAPARDILGVAFGVRRRELTSRITGACDEPGPDRIGLDREAERLDFGLGRFQFLRSARQKSAGSAKP